MVSGKARGSDPERRERERERKAQGCSYETTNSQDCRGFVLRPLLPSWRASESEIESESARERESERERVGEGREREREREREGERV